MKKKAVIFDMDGLMIDSERVTFECYKKILAETNRTMSIDFYRRCLGRHRDICSKIIEEEYGKGCEITEIVERVHDMLAEIFEKEGVPIKRGLVELLTFLKENKYTTIVATSSNRERVDTILEQSGLAGYFDGSVCGNEVTEGKPNPEIFLKACHKAGCEPREAYVLEDSEMGIEAAYAAGIDCIAVPDMKYPEEEYAKKTGWIAGSLFEVMEIIKNEPAKRTVQE